MEGQSDENRTKEVIQLERLREQSHTIKEWQNFAAALADRLGCIAITDDILAALDRKTLQLREIDIAENQKEQRCQHTGIKSNRYYLAIIYGAPFVGKFIQVWYGLNAGWNFQGWVNPAGIQLNAIERLYEIKNAKAIGIKL